MHVKAKARGPLVLQVLDDGPKVGVRGNPVLECTMVVKCGLVEVYVGRGIGLRGWLKDDLDLVNPRRTTPSSDSILLIPS